MKIERPYRQKRTQTVNVAAAADDVFALMCPVREYDWIPGWKTNLILSSSGVVEEGCVFTTPAGGSETGGLNGGEAIWITPVHDPENRRLMMIKVTPGEGVTRLDIAIDETPDGSAATISYEHTALSRDGRGAVDQLTEESYAKMMAGWKAAIEAFLSADKAVA